MVAGEEFGRGLNSNATAGAFNIRFFGQGLDYTLDKAAADWKINAVNSQNAQKNDWFSSGGYDWNTAFWYILEKAK